MFRFRLEKVLRHRSRKVEEQARRMRGAESECRRLETAREALQKEGRERAEAAAESRTKVTDISAWMRQAEYTTWLQHEAQRLLPAIKKARSIVAEQRRLLVELHRDEEVLLNLKKKQEDVWRFEETRRERKQMDEICSRLAGAGGKT